MTDPHASHAIKLVFRNLKDAIQKKSLDPLEGMAIASLEAGAAFSNAILGAVHALAHPLGGHYDIHHGLANSILLPVVLKKNLEHAPEKYALIANAMGIDTRGKTNTEAAELVPERIEGLIRALHIPTKLSQLGVRLADIPDLARDAAEDLCMMTNPQHYGPEEIEAMYKDAL
jgi:alcohol dehydrogenase class IV